MSPAATAKRVVLGLVAVVFTAIAVASLAWPHKMAEPLGLGLVGTNGLNEFRAIYVGLWLAQAVIFVWAAIRVENVALGDVCTLLLFGQVAGRLLSAAIDGLPDSRLLPTALAELAGAAVLLALRTRRSSTSSSS